jgi:hypothetical protein
MEYDEFQTPVVKLAKRRSSFFGFDQAPAKNDQNESIDDQKYFEKLTQEGTDWFHHLHRINKKLKE